MNTQSPSGVDDTPSAKRARGLAVLAVFIVIVVAGVIGFLSAPSKPVLPQRPTLEPQGQTLQIEGKTCITQWCSLNDSATPVFFFCCK